MVSFEELKQEYSECQNCTKCANLIKSRSKIVFGSGNPQSKILFIGEAPGFNEDQQGVPFCGASGQILEKLLSSVGLSRQDIFITNTILCRPENNRNPAKNEVENCRGRLDKLIAVMQPKVIVTIGNFATERILGKTGIKSLHGNVFPFVYGAVEIKVVPVVHPANLLYSGRNPQLFDEMKKDFQVIADLIKESF